MVNCATYKRFRQLTQVIDTIILDIDCLQYNSEAIALATIFCVVGLSLKIFTQSELFQGNVSPRKEKLNYKENISENIIQNSKNNDKEVKEAEMLENLKKMDNYVLLFSMFLTSNFSLTYDELIPTIEYVTKYAGGIKFSYELPHAFTLGKKDLERKRIQLNNPSELRSLIVHNKGSGAFVRWLKAHS